MNYTDLDIIEAIKLVKAGCEDIEICGYDDWGNFNRTKPMYIDDKYRIKTDKLNEWNENRCDLCGLQLADGVEICDDCFNGSAF